MANNISQFFYKNNRLQQLRGFCAAMQFGNLSHAAQYLGLSHTAISLQVKSLEEDLKVKLFERKGPKIVPTKDAEVLYKVSKPHVEGINDIYNEFITQKEQETSDEIRIGANNSALSFLLPKLLKPYLKQYPNKFVKVIFAEQEDGLKKLKNGEIDTLLIPRREHNPIDQRYFDYEPLFFYVPVLFTLPDHPLAGKKNLTVEEICKYDVTLPSKGLTVIPHLDEVFAKYRVNKRLKVSFENWSNTRMYIEAGLAIAIVADLSHEGKKDMLHKTPLTHLFPNVDYGFVTLRNSEHNANIRSLLETGRKYSEKLSSDLVFKKK